MRPDRGSRRAIIVNLTRSHDGHVEVDDTYAEAFRSIFAEVLITYTPDERCVELKSLKLYLWSYRDQGAFHEDVVNRILDDLVELISPRSMTVEAAFYVRGGIQTTVVARHP